MDDTDDVLEELRGTPNRSSENSESRVLDRLRETLADPEPRGSKKKVARKES